MRKAYTALLSLIVAYSAYVGATSPRPQQGSATTNSQASRMGSSHEKSLVEHFPTIAGGHCPIEYEGAPEPCDCDAVLCPAQGFLDAVKAQFPAPVTGKPAMVSAIPPALPNGAVVAGNTGGAAAVKYSRKEHWGIPEDAQDKLTFVIATVPDPIHTHAALWFDRAIDQIEGAAQASGFLFTRSWMPWDIATHPESPDFTVRKAQQDYLDEVESLPGIMFFKRSDTTLVVLVVGETQTGGIHTEQFQHALQIREKMLMPLKPPALPESSTLRILGPTFSGSLASLKNALQDSGLKATSVVIRSGTVNSAAAIKDFCESSAVVVSPFCSGKLSPPEIPFDFAGFQYTDQAQEYYLARFFCEREGAHSHVAVVSEDETTFGNLVQPPLKGAAASNNSDKGCGPLQPLSDSFIRLYFPRGIAQLRDAYQQNVAHQQTSETKRSAPEPGLPLSLQSTGNEDDSVTTYAPLQTPLSEDTIMQSLVMSLRSHHAKVVIIRAGDPLDTVFLARYFRQNYSQARLVTVGADLLMVHEFYDPKFHGILATTTYPLISGADFPTIDRGGNQSAVRQLFPDSYSAGLFNALLSLLPDQQPAQNSPATAAGTLPPRRYVQIGIPSFLYPQPRLENGYNAPHLWLTAIGRDGYQPVTILDDPSDAKVSDSSALGMGIRSVDGKLNQPDPPYSVHLSLGWLIFWIPAVVTILFYSLMLVKPCYFRESETLSRFEFVKDPTRTALLFAGGLLLLAFQSALALPAFFWGFRHGWSLLSKEMAGSSSSCTGANSDCAGWGNLGLIGGAVSESLNGLPIVYIAYLLSAAVLGVALYIGMKKRSSAYLAFWGGVICVLLFIGFFGGSIYFSCASISSSVGSFVFRYINVGSGVSPALPILFLVGTWTWWCWQSFTGIVIVNDKQIQLPIVKDALAGYQLKPVDELHVRAVCTEANRWPWKGLGVLPPLRTACLAVLGWMIVWALMRPSEIAETFDLPSFKDVYWALLYVSLLLVTILASQIVMLWLQFRELLKAVEALPLRRGFGETRSLTWKPLWKLASTGMQEFIQLLRQQMDVLQHLLAQSGELTPYSGAVQRAIDSWDDLAKSFGSDDARKCSDRSWLREKYAQFQIALAGAAAPLLAFDSVHAKFELHAQMPESATSDADTKDDKDSTKGPKFEPPSSDPILRMIEHFLALFYLSVILVPLRRLQTMILALAGVFVFVLLSYSSYPFESRESFHAMLICIFFGISAVIGVVYGQMFANPLLSRITNTNPGEVGLDFWIRLGSFVFIPLLSLLSVQFPEINSFLFSWLQPAMQSIK